MNENREDAWIKRYALSIASQLPEDPQKALAVLDHVKHLVMTFLTAPPISSDNDDYSAAASDDCSSLTHKS
jgi:hypothetical protein